MPLKEHKHDDEYWMNGVTRAMRFDEEQGHNLETWNSCYRCGAKWKDPIRTEGIMHRFTLCGSCVRTNA